MDTSRPPADHPRMPERRLVLPPATTLRSGAHRILSLHPPWAWAILFAGKDVENRSWTTPYRGRFLVHASSKKLSRALLEEAREEIAEKSGLRPADIPEEFPRCQILGSVELVDCVEHAKSPWAYPGEQHWKLANPQRLATPAEDVMGKLNLWTWTAP